jgi:hypothetical protein
MSRRARLLILWGVAATSAGGLFLFPPIAQNPSYHNFADQRSWAGIPNALNVLSNLPFLVVGVAGVWLLASKSRSAARVELIDARERWAYVLLFIGAGFTSLGSAYYHWAPSNSTLVWDRLPMAVGFMGLLAAVIAERISVRAGVVLLGPLVAAGIASVSYWRWTELQGRGDLRFYILVQFLSLLIILFLILLMPPRYTRGADFMVAIGFYALAKVLEVLDAPVMALGGIVSGHTLKHLAVAAAIAWLLRMLTIRKPNSGGVAA